MKSLLAIFALLMGLTSVSRAQITIHNVSSISITDKLNINYERVNSYTFEIRFKDSIELWHTKQVSRGEFQQEIFRQEIDSIYADLQVKRREIKDKDSSRLLYADVMTYLKDAYKNYCDTVKPVFIKYIPEKVITDLLKGLRDSNYSEQTLKSKLTHESVSYGNHIQMTSYYPLVGMTVFSSKGDTLVVYNDGQQDLMIPWLDKNRERQLYNPLINWSLDAILPEDMSYNKKRLTNGMKR